MDAHLYDIELVDSRGGRDIASLLDDSIRHARAAYAVVHIMIDKEKALMRAASCHRDVRAHRNQVSNGSAPRTGSERSSLRNTDRVDREASCVLGC